MSNARLFATIAHQGQVRLGKHKKPTIAHCEDVARITTQILEVMHGGAPDPEVLAAAWLHDVVEDTKYTLAEVAVAFGPVVARYVDDLTDPAWEKCGIAERKQKQKARVPSLSKPALIVKIADQVANLHDLRFDPPQAWSREQVKGYLQGARDVANECFVYLTLPFDSPTRHLITDLLTNFYPDV